MRFVANPTFGSDAEREIQPALRDEAERVKSRVQAIAPHRTGSYRRSLEVYETPTGVSVVSTDPFAHLVEWGSAKNPPYAPLRRGALSTGLRLREDPKT